LTIETEIDASVAQKPSRRFRAIIADAFAFIRGVESNRGLSATTLEELITDQIKRNGESNRNNAAQYNPYSYTPGQERPASEDTVTRVNFLGGSDTGGPTKLDKLTTLKNELDAAVDELLKLEPLDVADKQEYNDATLEATDQELA